MSVGLIWAEADGGVIGAGGAIPWRLPEDQALFKAVTLGGAVVMGRRTWESLPASVRPLSGRRNVVLSRQPGYLAPGADVLADPGAVTGSVWVIGAYEAFLPIAQVAVVTRVRRAVAGDVMAPTLDADWRPVADQPWAGQRRSVTGLAWSVTVYVRAGVALDAPLVQTLTSVLEPVGDESAPPS